MYGDKIFHVWIDPFNFASADDYYDAVEQCIYNTSDERECELADILYDMNHK